MPRFGCPPKKNCRREDPLEDPTRERGVRSPRAERGQYLCTAMNDDAAYDVVGAITRRAYARVGLLGNPSDGYFGKTVSVSIANFFSEVSLTPNQQPCSARITFEPGPLDSNVFATLGELAADTAAHGPGLSRRPLSTATAVVYL